LISSLLAAALAATVVTGTWVTGSGPATKVYVLKAVGDGFVGSMCGPCDDPSTVFRVSGAVTTPSSSTITLKRAGADETVAVVLKTEPTPPNQRLDGRWVAAGRVAQQNFTLKLREGNKVWGVICGPCDKPEGVFLIDDGVLEGDAVSFFIHHFDPAGLRRNHMRGVITGNVMKFTWVREGRENEPGGEMTLIGPIR